MIEWFDIISSDLASQFLNPKKRLFLGYLLSASIIAILWLCLIKRHAFGAAVRAVFDRRIWLSRSSRHDVICFMVNRVLFTWLRPVLVTQLAVATLLFQLLHHQTLVPVGLFEDAGYLVAAISFTLFFFLFDDFTRFAVHLALHRIPVLWAFHKFHHSAETLTPLTVTRTHPVEGLIFTARSAVVQGVSIAGFIFLFGNQVDLLTIFGVNIFVIIFHGLGSNLRHSHIPIRYPLFIERFLMSPAQHQLHHSEAEHHFDRNFGVALSVWDRMLGSFHHSVDEKVSFGIGRETAAFTRSVWSMYWSPFRFLLRRIMPGRGAPTARRRLHQTNSAS
ncbi:MAG: sterol desaturase family protein [Pseudomonadota bacterium]|nr:sterol desaturase family protein [Pseudomonadota bacterium]